MRSLTCAAAARARFVVFRRALIDAMRVTTQLPGCSQSFCHPSLRGERRPADVPALRGVIKLGN
jgi:hypothetical protein